MNTFLYTLDFNKNLDKQEREKKERKKGREGKGSAGTDVLRVHLNS